VGHPDNFHLNLLINNENEAKFKPMPQVQCLLREKVRCT